MDFLLSKSKNDVDICSIDGFFLHSKYDPIKEASRFVNSITCDFNPSCIVITGIGFSYIVPFLKERYPNALLIGIHYTDKLSVNDSKWDKVFFFTEDTDSIFFENDFFSYLGEEKISSTLFLSWIPSEKIFLNEYKRLWVSIKNTVKKSCDIINTRTYFEKRWAKNAVKLCLGVKNVYLPQKQNKDIIVACSGPTLKNAIPFIKANIDKVFLIAVSSAIFPLLENNIYPDLCISTDGGYWAKEHLNILNKYSDIPLALATEASLNSSIFEKQKIVPAFYGDGVEYEFLKASGLSAISIRRNGTVSGTALELALELTDKNVYLTGIDLCSNEGFLHTQPNMLEIKNSCQDFRLKPKENRISHKENSNALLVYANWFDSISREKATRIFRMVSQYDKKYHKFQTIKEIRIDEIKLNSNKDAKKFDRIIIPDAEERRQHLLEYIDSIKEKIQLSSSEDRTFNLFARTFSLKDYLIYRKTQDNNALSAMKENCMKEISDLEELVKKYNDRNI